MSIFLPLPRSLKDPLGRCQLYVSIRANFASSAKLDDYGRSFSAATIVLLLVDKIKVIMRVKNDAVSVGAYHNRSAFGDSALDS